MGIVGRGGGGAPFPAYKPLVDNRTHHVLFLKCHAIGRSKNWKVSSLDPSTVSQAR